MLDKLLQRIQRRPYLPFEQDGVTYNLYEMPKGFVIKGNVDISNKGLTELPDLSDVIVKGDFNCSKNSLTSLKGVPQEVGGSFLCYGNKLVTLDGGPQKVGRDFNCVDNNLTSLQGGPQKVGGYYDCSNNHLTTLKGVSHKIKGNFFCRNNNLSSLEFAPEEVGGTIFECRGNLLLESLVGIPLLSNKTYIHCDDNLAKKYGARSGRFQAENLFTNSVYQNEVKMYEARRKLQLKEKTMQENAPKIAKTQAAFEAWLKKNGKETPEK